MEERQVNNIAFIAGQWPLAPERPTLVFIHGAGGSGALWQAQVAALKDVANTIAVDLPGHGRSPGPGHEQIAFYARSVKGLIDELKAPGPVPVGLSMGGGITQQLLVEHPDFFPGAVLVSTGARLRVLPQIFEKIHEDFNGFLDLMSQFSGSPKTPPEALKSTLEDMKLCGPQTAAGDFKACDGFDVMARLSEIRARVLVVTGQDDMLTPPKYGEFLEQKIPGARRVHVMDCGHMIPLEKPDELNRALREFIEEL